MESHAQLVIDVAVEYCDALCSINNIADSRVHRIRRRLALVVNNYLNHGCPSGIVDLDTVPFVEGGNKL